MSTFTILLIRVTWLNLPNTLMLFYNLLKISAANEMEFVFWTVALIVVMILRWISFFCKLSIWNRRGSNRILELGQILFHRFHNYSIKVYSLISGPTMHKLSQDLDCSVETRCNSAALMFYWQFSIESAMLNYFYTVRSVRCGDPLIRSFNQPFTF